MQLKTIFDAVEVDMVKVEDHLDSFTKSSEAEHLSNLLSHVFDSKGKRARPVLTLLSGGFSNTNRKNVIRMASAVEMLHIATLVHDDTVDEAKTRRGRVTVSSNWGQHTAVLLGDYIFAASATYVCDTKNVRVIRRFSETIMELSRGELLEISAAFQANFDLGKYLERIYLKTGSLFSTAGESGAVLSEIDETQVSALKTFSYKLGMAFQVMDDILDFEGDEKTLGKPVGSDLLNGIITLPVIYASENTLLKDLIDSFFSNQSKIEIHSEITELIKQSCSIEKCYTYARNLIAEAKEQLSLFPRTKNRDALESLSDFIISRMA